MIAAAVGADAVGTGAVGTGGVLAAVDTDEQRLDLIIEHLESTAADDWQTDVVRRDDPNGVTRNCFFGHLYDLAGGDDPFPVEAKYRPETCGSHWWNWFENRWATTFRLYPINDGQDHEYPQATAKERVIAFLRDLRSGRQLATEASMDADYARGLADDTKD